MSSLRWTLWLTVAACLTALGASATTLQPLSTSEITWVADRVVEATVLARTPERVPGSRHIQTAVALRVDVSHKGDASEGQVFDLVLLGGRMGEERSELVGAPTFTPGERVIAFVEFKHGEWRLVGLNQGKYTLVEEPDTGRDCVVRVRVPESVESFDEAEVQVAARPRYADDFLATVTWEIASGHVPPYRFIAGLSGEKDAQFRFEAELAGQVPQAWWTDPELNPHIDGANPPPAVDVPYPGEVLR